MKIKELFSLLALSGLALTPQLHAQSPAGYDFTQDEPAGYDFTQDEQVGYDFTQDDDSDAATDKAEARLKALQALIYNGAQYEMACRKAYQEDIVWVISACCDGIIGDRDYVDCTYDPDPASLHRAAFSKIRSKHPFAPGAGQFMEGILSRAILKQAKPNISAQQYANIEHMITRSEMLVKWFTGSFAKACEAHDYDFLKEVQRVARFKEYTKSDTFRELDGLFFDMSEVFRGSYVRGRAEKALSGFHSDRKRNSIAVFRHFRKTVNQLERDSWVRFIVLGGSYLGPTFGVDRVFNSMGVENPFHFFDIRGGRVMMNGSYEASRMSSYMRYFDFWTQARLDATAALGDKLDNLTRMASGEFLSGVSTVAGEIVIPEDADFKRAVSDRALYALDKLDSMDRELTDFPKYLHDNTNFLQNRKNTKAYGSLIHQVQICADDANKKLDAILQAAQQEVPASDPLRQSD